MLLEETIVNLLQGWSLGGILSLEIAHVITVYFGLRALGIIMIDSIYFKNIDVALR